LSYEVFNGHKFLVKSVEAVDTIRLMDTRVRVAANRRVTATNLDLVLPPQHIIHDIA
jgi:hypothetical protein